MDRRLFERLARYLVPCFFLGMGGGCEDADPSPGATPPDAGSSISIDASVPDAAPDLRIVTADPSDEPLFGLDVAQLETFRIGDELFGTAFREADGLGPLYIRTSCAACHAEGGRGPGSVQKFQLVDAVTRLPVIAAAEMPFGPTERPYAIGGATPLMAPAALPGHTLIRSRRVGPTVMGRGYIEAVLDSEIERVATLQAARTDGIHGHPNRVTYHSQTVAGVAIPHANGESGIIGRFGLKARVATLDDFTADAFQGDMGLTSPMRPDEVLNPDGLRDDRKPGADMTADFVIKIASYIRTIDIPARQMTPMIKVGQALFNQSLCSACHVATLKTRPDYPVKALANIDAPVYSDLLLHDMGDDLADFLTDESAGPRDWRTSPLLALRFQRAFLHDGRALTVEDAILKHAGTGSEANGAVEQFKALSPADRAALVAFVQGL